MKDRFQNIMKSKFKTIEAALLNLSEILACLIISVVSGNSFSFNFFLM